MNAGWRRNAPSLHQKGGWGQCGSGGWGLEPSQCQSGHIACPLWTPLCLLFFPQEGIGFLSSVAPSLPSGSQSPYTVKSQREAVLWTCIAGGNLSFRALLWPFSDHGPPVGEGVYMQTGYTPPLAVF
uniref:Uncharacterized protein n=1 Tax=Pipistrellus kuhlii TaxID=59472 RepID=A0A7J7ZIQ3_PIPKU|nr:hypothetical protein mPipKuh1_009382 [Pipistrellus kuhlii]